MAKKQKRKSVDRENLSPLAKLKLNQQVKDAETLLSGDVLTVFRELSQADKRDVIQKVLKKATTNAIDDEIIEHFKQINAADTEV